MHLPGFEPGSTAWKAAMLTTIPLTLLHDLDSHNTIRLFQIQSPDVTGQEKGCHCRDQDSNLGYCGHNAGS